MKELTIKSKDWTADERVLLQAAIVALAYKHQNIEAKVKGYFPVVEVTDDIDTDKITESAILSFIQGEIQKDKDTVRTEEECN